MSYEYQSSYDYHEICKELGVSYEKFMEFIRQNNEPEQNAICSTVTVTINDAVNMFLNSLQVKVRNEKRSEETYNTYKSFMVNFCLFLKNKYPTLILHQINEIHLDQYLKGLNSNSAYTSNTYTAILRSFFKYCYSQQLINNDIRHRFEWSKEQLLPRYIRDHHLDHLLRQSLQMINGYRNHAIISVLAGTGLRISELTSLKIKEIDRARKVIFVSEGKGNKQRYVTLYPEVEQIILDFLNITGFKEWDPDHDGFVFATDYGKSRGNAITANAIEKMFQRLCKRANIDESYTPHSLRHTFAVRALATGMRLEYLSQLLGHTSIETTKIYIQLLPEDLGRILTEKYPFPLQNLLFRSLGVD